MQAILKKNNKRLTELFEVTKPVIHRNEIKIFSYLQILSK